MSQCIEKVPAVYTFALLFYKITNLLIFGFVFENSTGSFQRSTV
jgi:hypothetical protein